MSHAMGAIKFHSDDLVVFYEYDGTADIILPQLWATAQEVSDHWRGKLGQGWPGWDKLQSCNHPGEPADIASNYGGTFWWKGKACRECMVIHGPHGLEDFYDLDIEVQRPAPEWSGFKRPT